MERDKHKELMPYQQVLDHINEDMEDNRKWKFWILVTGQTVFMVQASDAVHPRNSTD
jgi:hypothetical protein